MHIVLIRFSSMGDVVLQSPFIAWIKLKLPQTKITFVTSSEFKGLVQGHDLIDHVITHDRNSGMDDIQQLKSIANQIKLSKPDLIIDLHNTLRAKLIRFFCWNIPQIKVNKRTMLRNILIYFKIDFLNKLSSHHERIIEDFKFLFSTDYDRDELENFVTNKSQENGGSLTTIPLNFQRDIPRTIEGDYIVISPVASFAAKRWPIENFKNLVKKILDLKELEKYKIVIIAGPKDDYCNEFNQVENLSGRLINLQGKTTIEQTNEVLSYAKLVVTNDTGVGHMAEALGIDVFSIFGPTSPSFGFRPHRLHSKAITAAVSCSPCSATGSKACSQKVHSCMLEITVDQILENIQAYFAKEALC